ncbi:MAG: D-alanyl-D-alanine carboxypeptidase [Ruminococcaceae bacterium]|nr:D-alanyl-D-alanine carboxypeptidase [Oscillospiraceae bacterium]
MPRFVQKILVFCLALTLLAGAHPCRAASFSCGATAYVLMDADSGRVLLAHNETEERAIASTTKIMTAVVALEHSRLTDKATVKREHLREGSSMYLVEGETLTMEALLYGLMLPSGNDAAECIADSCGGGTENFVRWMNEKAAALGMTHTSYANPSGLDAEGHYSCALDMARLMAYAMRQPMFALLVSSRTATAGERVMANHNKLLGTVEGCIGGKTGYTGNAGKTLVTCAERNGLRLIAVTLNDSNDKQDHAAMYEAGFSAYRSVCAAERGKSCALCAVRGGEASCLRLTAEESFFYPVAEGEALTLRVEAPDAVTAPIAAGERLGRADILLDGTAVGSVALVAEEDVRAAAATVRTEQPSWLRGLFGGKR